MEPGSLVGDRFEIVQAVRKGGMAQVYRAIDRGDRSVVALKVLGDQWKNEAERFLREAIALERLRHPSIVRYVAHGSAGGVHYLAMEWLDGEDLSTRLERGALSLQESIAVASHVSHALAVAHAAGVVHRDIKPSNIFLVDGRCDRAKVIDFGIARMADRADLTGPGVIFGTAGYMAPEQARGERRIDARADVFALGCVLFECISGRPVFAGAHPTAVLAKVVLEDAPRLRTLRDDVPDSVDRLVARMLSKVPGSRPVDARQLAREIEALGRIPTPGPEPVSVRPESLGAHEQRLVSVVMTGGNEARQADQTIAIRRFDEVAGNVSTFDAFVEAVKPFGAKLEYLRNGSLVASIVGHGNAGDQARDAARCALALRAQLSDVPIVVVMGRGILGERLPVGQAIDHAVEMLRASSASNHPALLSAELPSEESGTNRPAAPKIRPVRVDAMTAALLDARFELDRQAGDWVLRGEREPMESSRTLLGKATPFVGRERELGFLRVLLEESSQDRVARAVLVTGAAGMGKSRVRQEFLRIVHERPTAMHVWIARGDPMSAGSPFGLVAQIVRRAVGMREGEPIEVRRQKLKARVAERVNPKRATRVAQFLGELVGTRFEEESLQLLAARQDPMLMGDQMRAAWEDFLDAESNASPVVLVLEDLHWGDLPSVQFVDAALRNLRDRPLLVLALARPEVHELFPQLWAQRGLHELRLGELSKKASEKLVRDVLGERATDDVVSTLVERAAGNALYLEELIRAVVEGKRAADLPDTVVAMVQARLERLEPDARRVLRAASVFGQVFWKSGVAALLGGKESDEARLREWLDELVEREMIARRGQGRFPGEDDYAFHHALVREAAYAMLTEQDRRLGHALAGNWLEIAGESDAMTLAEHLERGGENQRAIGWYRRASEAALEGNDFEAVIARAERGVQCGATGEMLGTLRVLQAEANRWRGDLAGAEACALDAMRLLPRSSPAWFNAVGDLALASGRRAKLSQLSVLAQMLLDLGNKQGASGPQIVASTRAAIQLLFNGKADLAERIVRYLEHAQQVETNPAVLARIHLCRYNHALCVGDIGPANEFARAAIDSFEAVGDRRGAVTTRGEFAFTQVELGAYEQATETFGEVLDTADRLGRLAYARLAAQQNLGMALARLGKLGEARAAELIALDASRANGDARMEGDSRTILAEIARLEGRLDEALDEARRATEVLSVAPPARTGAFALQAQIELARGDTASAVTTARRAQSLLDELHVLYAGESLVRLVWAEALHAIGEPNEAKAAILVARERLLARAERIRDAGLRKSFLENVPENARTLELAKNWAGAA